MISHRRVEKGKQRVSVQLTVWSLVMVRNQLPGATGQTARKFVHTYPDSGGAIVPRAIRASRFRLSKGVLLRFRGKTETNFRVRARYVFAHARPLVSRRDEFLFSPGKDRETARRTSKGDRLETRGARMNFSLTINPHVYTKALGTRVVYVEAWRCINCRTRPVHETCLRGHVGNTSGK